MVPAPARFASAEFLRFLVAGAAGFAVDSVLLLAFAHGLGWEPLPARLVSFAIALVSTWLLNRLWTFRTTSPDKSAQRIGAEFLSYSAVQATGFAINFLIYGAVVSMTGKSPIQLLVAVTAGSAASLVINYFGARKFVFGAKA